MTEREQFEVWWNDVDRAPWLMMAHGQAIAWAAWQAARAAAPESNAEFSAQIDAFAVLAGVPAPAEPLIVAKECAERGCCAHDPRVDGDGVKFYPARAAAPDGPDHHDGPESEGFAPNTPYNRANTLQV
jgi:hypothetical protein